MMPARSKVREVEHLAPYAELPAFLASLRPRDATAARALEFLILTAARTGEVAHSGTVFHLDEARCVSTI